MEAIITKAIYAGAAAFGIAVMLNLPRRFLITCFLISSLTSACHFLLMQLGLSIESSTFIGAAIAGLTAMLAGKRIRAPSLMIALPTLIPMVPGVLAYKFAIGILELSNYAGESDSVMFLDVLRNGFRAMLITFALAGGVLIPHMLRPILLHRETL